MTSNLTGIVNVDPKIGATYLKDSDIISLWRLIMYKSIVAREEDIERAISTHPHKIIEQVKHVGALPIFWLCYINKISNEEAYKQYTALRRKKYGKF
jgi:hypothetical protein